MALIRNCPTCGRSNRIPAKHLSDVGKCGACMAELPAIGEPIEVNEQQFNEIIRQSKVPVLTDFWASWCGPCRTAAPHVAQTAQDLAGRAVVLKVDTDLPITQVVGSSIPIRLPSKSELCFRIEQLIATESPGPACCRYAYVL